MLTYSLGRHSFSFLLAFANKPGLVTAYRSFDRSQGKLRFL
jgi:hypothetical protein